MPIDYCGQGDLCRQGVCGDSHDFRDCRDSIAAGSAFYFLGKMPTFLTGEAGENFPFSSDIELYVQSLAPEQRMLGTFNQYMPMTLSNN